MSRLPYPSVRTLRQSWKFCSVTYRADGLTVGNLTTKWRMSRDIGVGYSCGMTRILVALIAPAALALPAAVHADASHKGWPKINGDLKMHKADQDGELRATKLSKHNELLGGHGDDVITAGNAGDVLWGDYKAG